jgi:hypothetical protein
VPDQNLKVYKCVCTEGRSGKYCHLKSSNTSQPTSIPVSTPIKITSTKSLIPVTTTRNVTNIDKSTVSLKMLNESSVVQTTLQNVIKNSTLTAKAESLIVQSCNYESCQLGKCLKNG